MIKTYLLFTRAWLMALATLLLTVSCHKEEPGVSEVRASEVNYEQIKSDSYLYAQMTRATLRLSYLGSGQNSTSGRLLTEAATAQSAKADVQKIINDIAKQKGAAFKQVADQVIEHSTMKAAFQAVDTKQPLHEALILVPAARVSAERVTVPKYLKDKLDAFDAHVRSRVESYITQIEGGGILDETKFIQNIQAAITEYEDIIMKSTAVTTAQKELILSITTYEYYNVGALVEAAVDIAEHLEGAEAANGRVQGWFKRFVRSVVRIVATVVLFTATAAIAGSVVGSAFPGAGTLIGAAVGGAAGFIVGIIQVAQGKCVCTEGDQSGTYVVTCPC